MYIEGNPNWSLNDHKSGSVSSNINSFVIVSKREIFRWAQIFFPKKPEKRVPVDEMLGLGICYLILLGFRQNLREKYYPWQSTTFSMTNICTEIRSYREDKISNQRGLLLCSQIISINSFSRLIVKATLLLHCVTESAPGPSVV